MHVHRAPNEKFLVGDGHNFGSNNRHEAPADAHRGAGDIPWSFDGIGSDSPGETIWKYVLPEETFITGAGDFENEEDLAAAVAAHPEMCVQVSPVCRFRSRMKMVDVPIRLESNAQVTPDSDWVVFQSCSESGFYEVWAARVPE
jgi:hypothetical protein